MSNVSLPEAYERLKDRRRLAESLDAMTGDLASVAREYGLDKLPPLAKTENREIKDAASNIAKGLSGRIPRQDWKKLAVGYGMNMPRFLHNRIALL